jgi:hypothetical protein
VFIAVAHQFEAAAANQTDTGLRTAPVTALS